MTLLAMLLSHYWKAVMLTGLIAAAMVYRATLIAERDAARAKVSALTAQTAALQAGNQALKSAIDHQNAAVEALRARADAEVNANAADQAAAWNAGLIAQQQAQNQASALAAAPIDPNTGCVGAIRWGNARAPELSQW